MPQVMRFGCELGAFLRPENNLREPFPVAQINEDDAAVIAENMHPAGENGGGANVAFAQLAAVMSPVHGKNQADKRAASFALTCSCATGAWSPVRKSFTFTLGHSSP